MSYGKSKSKIRVDENKVIHVCNNFIKKCEEQETMGNDDDDDYGIQHARISLYQIVTCNFDCAPLHE